MRFHPHRRPYRIAVKGGKCDFTFRSTPAPPSAYDQPLAQRKRHQKVSIPLYIQLDGYFGWVTVSGRDMGFLRYPMLP